MSAKKPPAKNPAAVNDEDPAAPEGRFQHVGGSQSDRWNVSIVNQTVNSLWAKYSSPEDRANQESGCIAALVGIGPKDELEGMMAAQMIAAHNATMECYRRAMIQDQSFEGRRENLTQANKLSRTYATLVEALNRHRGKGQQKVTVEHVHVHEGGQAVVGVVASSAGQSGEGAIQLAEDKAMQSTLPMHQSPRCLARTRAGTPCQSPAMANGRCRMHGGKATGAPKGNKNAFKHGRYTAEAVAERRALSDLLREMKALVLRAGRSSAEMR